MRNTLNFKESAFKRGGRFGSPQMLDSNSSIPTSTINMSFLPGTKAPTLVSSNAPIAKKVIMMPHLANKNLYLNKLSNGKATFNNFNTINFMDNSSEKSSIYDGQSIEHGKITFQNNTDLMNNTQENGFNDSSSEGTRRNQHNKL